MRYIFCFLCCFSFLHVLGSEASLNLQLDNYDQRTRLTIQLNHGLEYKVTHKKNKIMILLPKELALGSPISQKKLPSFIQRMTVAPHDNQLRILLDVVSGVTMRSFRAKNKLIVDVLHITPTRKEQQKEPPDSQKSHHAKPKPASNEPGSLTEPQQEKVESVKVTVHRQMGETPAYLQFHWEKPVAMALLQQGQQFWLAFGRQVEIIAASIKHQRKIGLLDMQLHKNSQGLILKGRIKPGRHLSVLRQGSHWIVTVEYYKNFLIKEMEMNEKNRQVHIPLKEAGQVMTITDPFSSRELTFVLLQSTQVGATRMYTMPDVNILQAEQGFALEHLTPNVVCSLSHDTLTIHKEPALVLSSAQDRLQAYKPHHPGTVLSWHTPLLKKNWERQKYMLMHRIQTAPLDKKGELRQKFARVLLYKNLYHEAMSQIEIALSEQTQLTGDLSAVGLLVVCCVMGGFHNKAKALLRNHPLPAKEFAPWRGIVLLEMDEDATQIYQLFLQGQDHMDQYPSFMRNTVALKAAEAAIKAKNFPQVFLSKMDMTVATPDQKDLHHLFELQAEKNMAFEKDVLKKTWLHDRFAALETSPHYQVSSYGLFNKILLSKLSQEEQQKQMEDNRLYMTYPSVKRRTPHRQILHAITHINKT